MDNENGQRVFQEQPDVRSTSTAIVPSSHKEATSLARVVSGDLPPNRGLFWCMTCGFNQGETCKYPRGLTVEFDEDEMLAFGGDPYAYQGPCPVCDKMTLVDMVMMGGDHFSVRGQASANRKKEYGEAADVFFEKAQEKIGGMMSGAMTGSPAASAPQDGPSRDHLPDAADVDLSDMKPRNG